MRFLAQELAFHGDDESDGSDPDAGAAQCTNFIYQTAGDEIGPTLVERKGDDVRFHAAKAGALFENARSKAFGKVDIKGQI